MTTIEHLSPDEIERLSKYQLKGDALLAALAHVEECAQCRLKVGSPAKSEVVNQIFRDEEKEEFTSDSQFPVDSAAPKKSAGKGWLAWLKKLFLGKKCYLFLAG